MSDRFQNIVFDIHGIKVGFAVQFALHLPPELFSPLGLYVKENPRRKRLMMGLRPTDLWSVKVNAMEPTYIRKIAEKLSFSLKQVNNVFDLRSEGATIPFMARYRKEATGNMDEVQISRVVEQIDYFTELDKRKETVMKTIDGLGKLTPELKARVVGCFDATELEDIYL